MEKPPELAMAEVIELLAQRYHCLPSEVRAASAYNLRHVRLLALAKGEGD